MQKRFIPILILAAMVLLAALGPLWGQDNRSKLLKGTEKDLVQFSGNVVATQGERVIQSDTLQVYFKKKAEGQGAAAGDAAKAGDIDRIVAKGNVRITEKERIVTGEQAVFHSDEQRIVVTGNPVMREGNNVITGDRVVVLLDENRGVVEGTTGKRVTATIYPDESKGKKKKE
jgi:lipopolysaccharide export system protein LptA